MKEFMTMITNAMDSSFGVRYEFRGTQAAVIKALRVLRKKVHTLPQY